MRSEFRDVARLTPDRFPTTDIPVSMHVHAGKCRAEHSHALPGRAKSTRQSLAGPVFKEVWNWYQRPNDQISTKGGILWLVWPKEGNRRLDIFRIHTLAKHKIGFRGIHDAISLSGTASSMAQS